MIMKNQKDQRISDEHLKRSAVIYIRQSTTHQVKLNTESTKLQIAVRERAISFGWPDPIIVDDDLGISAAGYSERPGFQRMLAMVTMKQVGIIFCFDASRLSRNNKDWANLFELCGFFDTLVSDTDQVYNLNLPNDRMVLGIKGTVSELELSILKARLKQGAIQKAKRGELKFLLPSGYCHDANSKIVMDPDIRVRKAISLLFSEFRKHTSIRQLLQWYVENDISFPVKKDKNNIVKWSVPKYESLKHLLRNPIFAGIYAYGRRQTIHEYKDGSLKKKKSPYLPSDKWKVCIKGNHDAFISWEEFLDNEAKILQNRPRWKTDENLCAIREGLALLVGLLRCGHCGKKLYVTYKTKKHPSAYYFCHGYTRESSKKCLSLGAQVVDKCVSSELLKAMQPAALEAGFAAIKLSESESSEKIKMAELDLKNAEYQSQRAFEQFDLVDPKNRLVADSLEKRLNVRLVDLKSARDKVIELKQKTRMLTDEEKNIILELSHDFKQVWDHEKANPVLKKQLLRLFIREVIVNHDGSSNMLHLIIHWQGGVHTKVSVTKRKTPVGRKADESLIEKIKKLSTCTNDAQIARILNMSGEGTPTGLRWNKDRVTQFRNHHRIRIKRRNKNRSDILSAEKASEYLGVSRKALDKLVKVGLIETNQVMSFAPWEIHREQLDSNEVKQAVTNLRNTGRLFPQGRFADKQLDLFTKNRNKNSTDD